MPRGKAVAEWVARFPEESLSTLGHLRCLPEVEATRRGKMVWLRGRGVASPSLRRVPDLEMYDLDAHGLLRHQGKRVPFASLPELNWQPLTSLWELSLPPTIFPAHRPAPCDVMLHPSAEPQDAKAMMVQPGALIQWAETAPQVRLDPLQFAASDDGRVLVLGDILPPVMGTQFWATGQVYVQCGWCWRLFVPTEILCHTLKDDDLVFLQPTEDDRLQPQSIVCDIVPAEGLLSMTREALRLTTSKHGWKT